MLGVLRFIGPQHQRRSANEALVSRGRASAAAYDRQTFRHNQRSWLSLLPRRL